MCCCVAIHLGLLLLFYIDPNYKANTVALLECIVTFVLTLLFIMTMCWLIYSLRKYEIHQQLSNQTQFVRIYFFIFFIGLASKAGYSLYWFITTIEVRLHLSFNTAVCKLSIQLLYNVLPIAVVFYMHHQTYKNRSKRYSGSTESSTEDTREIQINQSEFKLLESEIDGKSQSHSPSVSENKRYNERGTCVSGDFGDKDRAPSSLLQGLSNIATIESPYS